MPFIRFVRPAVEPDGHRGTARETRYDLDQVMEMTADRCEFFRNRGDAVAAPPPNKPLPNKPETGTPAPSAPTDADVQRISSPEVSSLGEAPTSKAGEPAHATASGTQTPAPPRPVLQHKPLPGGGKPQQRNAR